METRSVRLFLGLAAVLGTGPTFGAHCRSRYPFVLLHGIYASKGVISLRRAAEAILGAGCRVYLTEVSAANSIALRSGQLAPQIDQILRETGVEKVNLIGHSMGGLDGRFLISSLGYGDRVASLTTVSAPHRGTSAAEQLLNAPEGVLRLFGWLATFVGHSTSPQTVDLEEAIYNLTREFMVEFNMANPDDPRVYYQSFSGAASARSRGSDHLRLVLRPSHAYVAAREGVSDGLVPTESGKWGRHRGVLPADHFSQIGAGLPKGLCPFDFRAFFVRTAAELGELGF